MKRAHFDPMHSHNAECPVARTRKSNKKIPHPFFHSLSSQASAQASNGASLNAALSARIGITSRNAPELRAAARGRARGRPKLAKLEAEMHNLAICDIQFGGWKTNFLH